MTFRRILVICTLLVAVVHSSGPVGAADPKWAAMTLDEAKADPDFALQGEYTGPRNALQVVALGEGNFRVVMYRGGLPGANWDHSEPQVAEEDAEGVRGIIQAQQLTKTERKSPTLGANPPRGAVVLFDGKKETFDKHWRNGARMTDDGLLMQGATSQDTFRDFTIHVEFMLSYMPHARGQGRANSGVYYQGRYETQVLDSFGLEGKNNETGGIYEIRDPDLNMCLPPLTWQTYDVDFTAARFDKDGKKTANARMTVRLNGVVVQPDVEVPRITRAAPVPESPEPGPIYLQDHGNPIRYRNIWVVERDADREAMRPIVPGFERFYSQSSGPAVGGRLLAGELGCTNCHIAEGPISSVPPKQAPVLTAIGGRVDPNWMLKFIADPHAVKPGTTMPNLFAGWDAVKRDDAVLKLANFLASTGRLPLKAADARAVRRGEKLFHEVGCTVCHAPQNGTQVNSATSVPLTGIEGKYSILSLTEFLKDPHAVRPSGRMPNLKLERDEPAELANYLLRNAPQNQLPPNVRYAVYEGAWEEMPNLDELKPFASGECAGLDIGAAGRNDAFAIRFQGYFHVEKTARFTFILGSDDGSTLSVDGNKVLDNGGVHARQEKSEELRLDAGTHLIEVDYFEQYGEESLTLEVETKGGRGLPRQAVGLLLTPTEAPLVREENGDDGDFRFDPNLVDAGRELFATLGCAACHELKQDGEAIAARFDDVSVPKRLSKLSASLRGCLATNREEESFAPNFALAPVQSAALVAWLAERPVVSPAPVDLIHETMSIFNCYGCHSRGGVGGPEPSRNALFTTAIPEMGDEGRLPPPLDGVGDKLKQSYLASVLKNGGGERPYMHARMPNFSLSHAERLARAFAEIDLKDGPALAEFDEPDYRVKGTGRELVGDQALACIKCHTFSKYKATGIQAVSLTRMTDRIRPEWFLRYLYDPAAYRPGTRMPTGFPNGQAAVRDIYEGDPSRQISAVWTYLLDKDKAGIPDGLIAQMIELKPERTPIIYRNFLHGLSPRGIAVGYPEHANLAWDAEGLCLKLLWQGRFIDASQHWTGRGDGTQVPLGDHIIPFEPTVPIASLPSLDTPWPTQSPKQHGYGFLGYRLNEKKQPAFRYRWPHGEVTDFPGPVAVRENEGTFRRQLQITATARPENAYFRAAVGESIERQEDGSYLVDGGIRIHIVGGGPTMVRTASGRQELLVPLDFTAQGKTELVQEISW